MGETFRADASSVCVLATNLYYPIDEFVKKFDQDLKALMVFAYIKEGKIDFESEKLKKIRECAEYLKAKYEFFNQQLPESFIAWKEEIDERVERIL